MSSSILLGGRAAHRIYSALARHRAFVVTVLVLAAVAGGVAATTMRIDMSFRPVFTNDAEELAATAEFEETFGEVGFNDLFVMADVGDAADPDRLLQTHELAERLKALPHFLTVRDPLTFPYYDADGGLHPAGALAEVAAADSPQMRADIVRSVMESAPARRTVFGDGGELVGVTVSLDLAPDEFDRWRDVVTEFRATVDDWSQETGIDTQVTGYPEVEQVYATEVLISVLRGIAVLLVVMLVILFAFFRKVRDVIVCLAGVTLSVPLVLGTMTVLDQPFSIVNSQVLTLVLIVGIAEALHHQQEYRRRREAGRDHLTANREAFTVLGWPALTTGLATLAGFVALAPAGMDAISSFGLCTAAGVMIVYVTNWITVPALIHLFYRKAPASEFRERPKITWTLRVLARADTLLQRRPRTVVVAFLAATAVLGVMGAQGLSVNQKVNEELQSDHPALAAQTTYEHSFTGFLGPALQITPGSGSVIGQERELSAFVDRLCAMPEVRYVASPLDLVPQPTVPVSSDGGGCARQPGDLRIALAARAGQAGPALQPFARALITETGDAAAVVIRVPDIGTENSLPFVERVREAADATMPDATVVPVGSWWLAQQGMHDLSFEMMLSAVTALALVLPIIWVAVRHRKLFLAGVVPAVLPVFATLGFMGAMGISVRIGTAMILAIALGLAADDTIHLSVRIRERVQAGADPGSAVRATLLRAGRPASFSSYVLIGGFASMTASSLNALQEMGMVAAFAMSFALLTDLLLGPALYLLLARRAARRRPVPVPRLSPALPQLTEVKA
jgi:predicted RND superfamily exporter protein